MRIIGGHDYFDGALAYGQDSGVVFRRARFGDAPLLPFDKAGLKPLLQTEVRLDGGGRGGGRNEYLAKGRVWTFVPTEVWFAGRRYAGVCVSSRKAGDWRQMWRSEHVWDYDRLVGLLDELGLKPRKGLVISSAHSLDRESLPEHFSRRAGEDEVEWLIANRVSIAVWSRVSTGAGGALVRAGGWKIDVDGLGAMDFARALDPFSAFQELSMWVGGVLSRPGPETVEIKDDRVRAEKHGMDKWSFRRPPSA